MTRISILGLGLATLVQSAWADGPVDFEFFENHIRPLLAEKCYACHSAGTMALGDLKLDSKEALLRGGSRGAAISPGDPAASLLVKAVRYESLDLRMPPTGRLSDQEIAHLEHWIAAGAADPRTESPHQAAAEEAIDIAAGREFWSFRPVIEPALPPVTEERWVRTNLDRFILARLESDGLRPSRDADARTLLRRVTIDLTGLPPTPAEIDAFLADTSPRAYERAVERLLGSPHYGERWGRHWLDLVRWAETNGHEFDNNKLDAWRYRDYVIESFNADLPYDQFLTEQIAGDLLPSRLSADGTHYVTPIASGMYWLWEVLNSPTDSVKARADQVDNQIDVLAKSTQALTVACARCHDHKFDPIPTADYYSLFGILASTHMSEICIDSRRQEREIQTASAAVGSINREIEALLHPARARRADELAKLLLVGADEIGSDTPSPLGEELQHALGEPSHRLFPFARAALKQAKPDAPDFTETMDELRAEMAEWSAKSDPAHPLWNERDDRVYEDFEQGLGNWIASGLAFGSSPVRSLPSGQRVGGHSGQAMAASFGNGVDSLVGTLATEKFRMPARFVHVRMAGPKYDLALRENAPVRFTVIADGHKSGHAVPDGSGRLAWQTIAMTKERGRICSIEIVDRDRAGSIAVERIVFSSNPKPPPIAGPVDPRVLALFENRSIRTIEDLAQAYANLAESLSEAPELDASGEAMLAGILGYRKIEDEASLLDTAERESFRALLARRRELTERVPPSAFAMSSRDWMPADSAIYVRGNHKNRGDIAPRRYLQAVAGEHQTPVSEGSGRLELAARITSRTNPLTSRVMVNRVWHHHFGRGIVPSPDDFGRMGQEPSHPGLLDYLATRFMDSGWSVKGLHREIVLSSTYRSSSEASDLAKEMDPSNRLLSHFPVRRLEAEAVRDSMLSIAGTMDPTVGGPGIPPHISEHQDGRGKPASGPLNGAGRRSVYLQVRRNFLPPMFLAFDYPPPVSTAGRRGVSAVASQALLMLNNEFVNNQAALWADRILRSSRSPAERIRSMYVRAYGREPLDAELATVELFMKTQAQVHQTTDPNDRRVWSDLAHAIFNTAEFLFVR